MPDDFEKVSGVAVQVDKKNRLDYEVPGAVRRFFEKLYIPILNQTSWRISQWVRHSTKAAQKIHTQATTHHALEVLYLPQHVFGENILGRVLNFIWLHLRNSKAVRNRLQLVKDELLKRLEELARRDTKIYIFSIGAGSGRAIIETVAHFKAEYPHTKIKAILLDKSEEALQYSRGLASRFGVSENLEWVGATASNFDRSCLNFQPHIFEVVGLIDYFSDEKVVQLFTKIRKCLARGGYLIWGNIHSNIERRFITNTVEWHMIYREPKDLARLSLAAGFAPEKCHIIYEPLKIHGIAICKK